MKTRRIQIRATKIKFESKFLNHVKISLHAHARYTAQAQQIILERSHAVIPVERFSLLPNEIVAIQLQYSKCI